MVLFLIHSVSLSLCHSVSRCHGSTPYYMSPEIMNNQKYNSKTDVWSLGIILYELVCLRLPFQGNSMKQLCQNIINAAPTPPSSAYSKEMRDLVRDILAKDPRKRPSVNNILARPIIKARIANFLNETKLQREFCHTILHGVDVMRSVPTAVEAVSAVKPLPLAGALGPVAVRPAPPAPQRAPPPVQQQQQQQQQLQRQPSVVSVKPLVPSQVSAAAAVSAAAVRRDEAKPVDRRALLPTDAPKKVQEIIANMLRPPHLMARPAPTAANNNNNNNNRAYVFNPAPPAKYVYPANELQRKAAEKRPDSAPQHHQARPAPVPTAAVAVPQKIASPFEAIVGKAIRPSSAQSRPSSAQNNSNINNINNNTPLSRGATPSHTPTAAAPQGVAVGKRDTPVSLGVQGGNMVNNSNNINSNNNNNNNNNNFNKMKELNEAMNKAAAVMNVVKQEKEKLLDRHSPNPAVPMPVQQSQQTPLLQPQRQQPQPSSRAGLLEKDRRLSDPPPRGAVGVGAGEPWLANLQDKMGALKVQMQQMKAAKTPDDRDCSPVGFAVGVKIDARVAPTAAAAAAAVRKDINSQMNRREQPPRQSFPVEHSCAVIKRQQDKAKAVAPVPSLARQRSQNSVSPVPVPTAAKWAGVNRRVSDPMPQQLKVKIIDSKAAPKKNCELCFCL
jgi:hypothetical protein